MPRLFTAKSKINLIIANTRRGDRSNGEILDCALVKSWKTLISELWDKYLDGFLHDDLFLCATLLDPRNGYSSSLSWVLLKDAIAALKNRLMLIYEDKRHNRIQSALDITSMKENEASQSAPRTQVAESRTRSVNQLNLSGNVIAAASASTHLVMTRALNRRQYATTMMWTMSCDVCLML